MDKPDLEKLRRANAALEAWVRDLLEENRQLRQRLAEGHTGQAEPAHQPRLAEVGSFGP